MSRPEDENGFLNRWAKRKQLVQKEAAQLEDASAAGRPEVAPQTATDPVELPLPSLDDVLPGGDVSVFLQKHVPDALRNMALRKAWLADPEISSFIEMADYQLDYANPDSIPGWSSRLEGVDIKAMVERVFNNVAGKAEEPVGTPVNDAISELPTTEKLPENIIIEIENAEKATISTPQTPQQDYVALQNNTDDSGVYDTSKKRHGGALPS